MSDKIQEENIPAEESVSFEAEYKAINEVLCPKVISEIQQKYQIKPDMQVRVIDGVDFKIDKLKYDQFVPDC